MNRIIYLYLKMLSKYVIYFIYNHDVLHIMGLYYYINNTVICIMVIARSIKFTRTAGFQNKAGVRKIIPMDILVTVYT